jgi:ADP-dependent NAD(P)H-hydrate dehydratase / NAD(P)H-hydrate epimerase
MCRAAMALADQAERMLRQLEPAAGQTTAVDVLVLAGAGNNGADALLSGLLLQQRGYRVGALLQSVTTQSNSNQGISNQRLKTHSPSRQNAILRGGPTQSVPHPEILAEYAHLNLPIAPFTSLAEYLPDARLLIDGLLGIGQNRPLDGALHTLVAAINQSGKSVLAVDVPTGLNATTGAILGGSHGIGIRARATVTLLADKPGLHTADGKEYAGAVIVDRLDCELNQPADGERFDASLAGAMLSARAVNSHKGSFGSVLVIGGAVGMQGAALLAATGAQAAGAGKVFICSPDQSVFVAEHAQWMSRAWPPVFDDINAIALGCGLGYSDRSRYALQSCWNSSVSLVLDADALNLLADPSTILQRQPRPAATVMTPHPLEAARLLNCSTAEIQADRRAAAIKLAQLFACVVVLKGAGSIIASNQGAWSINSSGAPTLAVAGTGDVLAGVIATLLAHGRCAWDAARLAAFAHGRAGELMQAQLTLGTGLAAGELFTPIRQVFNGHQLINGH